MGRNYIAKSTVSKYVDAFATSLKFQLDTPTLKTAIASVATKTANTINITTYITKAKATVVKESLESKYIDQIKLAFGDTGNLEVKVTDSTYMLTVYPSFITSITNTSSLVTTLSLKFDNDSNIQKITNNYTIATGFKNYTTVDGLGSDDVHGIYASADGSTIYAATAGGLTIVNTKNFNLTKIFTTDNSTLSSDDVRSIYASADGNTIYAATADGVSVGTKVGGGTNFVFRPNTTSQGLGSNTVNGIYASADGNTIYAATNGGLSISKKNWFSASSNFNSKIIITLRKDL